ncbi:hypothetical protein Ahy_B07g088453 isoform A [Arachis hypogaea]|uniref:Uncharacterized protein n=1 Tax=Arachis hypogaea TaxID=3818 RepID=A0A444YEJ7_ARAHY|nr:hypothetical protein Ahy_B07g088453 isoform A [Arachis hypogaea]
MGYFKVKVYHGGWFTYKNGPIEYVGGETMVIEEIDGDRWSVFEAYAELKQLGYVKENIPSLWFKDPVVEDMEKNLKLFKTDADSIEIDHVELYVVHKVQDEELFPDDGYIDVGDKDGMGDISEGQELVLYGGVDEGPKQSEPFAAYSGVEDDNEVEYDHSSDSNSLDSEYNPSGEEDDREDDVHFTDSDDELDLEVSGFQHVNVMSKKPRVVKKNAGATEQFEEDEGGDSDDLDFDHQVGADGSDSEHESFRFPVNKLQKDMSQYKWEVGTLYGSREEFKDTVTAYAVHTARSIRFRKCDLQRVRAVCSGDCPFWVYAAKIRGEETWQLCSMNLTHTCTQAHRVGILHSKWLGNAFKKKVESNPKVKIRELVTKAQKKWNLTVTKSLATKIKHIALDQIQGIFREQYKRIYDYGQELMRANPGSSVCIQRTSHPDVMPPPYRKPSHRPMKKRRAAAGDEEQSSRTHLSRKGEKQRCSLCGSVGHNKSRCPKPIEELQSKNKGKQQKGSTKSNHLAAKGGRKTASSHPNPKQSVKRKAISATQPLSAVQSNNAALPKGLEAGPRGLLSPSAQPNLLHSPTRFPAQQVQHLLHPPHSKPPELFLHLSLPLPHLQVNLLVTSLPGFLEHLTFLQRN